MFRKAERLFLHMTGEENLIVGGFAKRKFDNIEYNPLKEVYSLFPILGERRENRWRVV
jgi:ABC-type branched-subunit amino acid transport system ATPase component